VVALRVAYAFSHPNENLPGTNSNIAVEHVLATTSTLKLPTVMCDPKAVSGDVGFRCWDGLYVPDLKGLF
jgi:hypothetical protein